MKIPTLSEKMAEKEITIPISPKFDRAVGIVFVSLVWLISLIVIAQNNQRLTTLEKDKKGEVVRIVALEKHNADLETKTNRILKLESTVEWMSEEMSNRPFKAVEVKKKWLFW